MFKLKQLIGFWLQILLKSYLFLFIPSMFYTSIKCESQTIPQLNYYEILHNIDIKHNKIVKRSAERDNQNESVEHLVSFRAIERDFNLLLTHNKDIISSQFNAFTVDSKGHKTPIFVDLSQHYSGKVDGIQGSNVRAHIDPSTGLMTASIHTLDETYEIEPIWRHSDIHKNNLSSMIVFKHSDLKHSNNATEESKPFCDFIKIDDNITNEEIETNERIRAKRQSISGDIRNYESDSDFRPSASHCSIVLVADYRFFEIMGNSDSQTTTNYLIHIIDRVNNIFNNTDWTNDESKPGFRGMGFFIKEIQIHEEPTPDSYHYNSVDRRPVNELLEIYSLTRDNSQFCLAHLFTHQSFDGSVLGLAYVASPRSSSVGGICSPSYQKGSRTLYLNTGLTTTKNSFGQRIITREAVLVTAHEFGHNWGSEHDPHTDECSPGSKFGGSYVMHTYSVTGYDDNNKFFSPCSKRSIRAVLMSKSNRCFIKPDRAYCGNSKVEEGEDCDEGLLVKGDDYIQGLCCDSRCRLLPGTECSDKNSDCCSSCRVRALGQVCHKKNDFNCKQESVCDGESDKCPEPSAVNNGTPCVDRGQCRSGKCISYCGTLGLSTCMCENERDACYRCCRHPSSNSTCRPIEPRDPLPDGTPCRYGFCERQRCERAVQDFVERFWDVIEEIDINTFLAFLKDNIVGVVIVISLIFWVPLSYAISFYDKKQKEELKRRSASVSSYNSGVRVSRNFSRKHSRPGFRRQGVTVTQQSGLSPVYYPESYL